MVVAMLVTGPHPEVLTAPLTTTAAEPGIAEHDVLDTALRLPSRQGHPVTPLRPATGRPESEPEQPRPHPVPALAPPAPSPALHALRCVVLRC
ncbi:hypothetical protein [Streptomyces sp. NPDC058249]|uniref:hypothetical protein n=1 Tax=Streptomyces sp. NPDC058249 TaxID=3346403 RepID=UPI0036F088B7